MHTRGKLTGERPELPIPRLKTLTPQEPKKRPEPPRPRTPPQEALGEDSGADVFYNSHGSSNGSRNPHHQHTLSGPGSGSGSGSGAEIPKSPLSDKPNTIVARQQSTPISTKPVRTGNPAALFATSVEDHPWGPPPAQQAPATTHAPLPQPVAQPSVQAFGAQTDGRNDRQQEEDDDDDDGNPEHDDIHAALRNTGPSRVTTTSSVWGNDTYVQPETYTGSAYNQSIIGFGDHPGIGARHGSFGGLGGNRVNGGGERLGSGNANGNSVVSLERVRAAMKLPEEIVNVNILPEKEGMFMFQHRNYQITSQQRGSRVVRRYSDFVWWVRWSLSLLAYVLMDG